ncbi:heterokaryon incompatibility protein-domain-containing protein [Paraphoma chrysanthemicola]|nr:heterokaryon incompatibility protein-domain-containing protein [Paraphoma chrysanthemicola]
MASLQPPTVDTSRLAKDPNRPLYAELGTDELRMLYLAPGSLDDALKGHLGIARMARPGNNWDPGRLASGDEYVALSYTWGDQTNPESIELNGHIILIGRSLASALRHVRLENGWCTLWADALCIDQQDDVEKSQQVENMPTIYEAAKAVIVWLGDGFDGAEEAFTWLRDLWNVPEEVTLSLDRINALLSPTIAIALERILALPWWRRVWVIQEITVGQEAMVMCGSSWAPFSRFVTLANLINGFVYAGKMSNPDCSYAALMPAGQDLLTIAAMRCGWKRCDGSVNFRELEALIRITYLRFCATDARDHFYALLSLAQPTHWLEIKPDYTLDRLASYLQVTLHLIRRKSCLDILQLGENLRRAPLDPSWLPSWDGGSYGSPPRQLLNGNASAGLPLSLSTSEDSRILRVTGLVIGELCFVSKFQNEEDQFKPPKCILNWLSKLGDLNPENPYLETCGLLEAFVRTLLAGNGPLGPVVSQQDTSGEVILRNVFLQWSTMTHPDSSMPSAWRDMQEGKRGLERDIYRSPPAIFRRHILESLHRRSFVVTTKGHVGLAPDEAEEGDLAVLLGGCSTPVCLRRENGWYRWVGAMYVHGAMAGELVGNSSSMDPCKLSEFEIH